ncbi:MAG: ABC transporter ATP-binding protein [Timaviella obliquedivisa GSE-PSE-MK23-08B]|jgi:lipopolysaccharide transport system ATP-binding protein|nr:ABC transporter ATP-binding protein [Timaviella obliquedivisa GSE-PSE-MK23-08B]
MNDPIISFSNVSKSYPFYRHVRGIKNVLFNFPKSLRSLQEDQFEALHDISFAISEGENFGIIGNNGAGKSTTLGLIAGVLKPNKGKVVVKGRVSPLLALGAGFHPELNGKDNIILNGILMGLTRRQVQSKLEEIIEFSELGEFIDRPIRVYSSGMLARLGFSVVAHLDPEILLIDEVLGVGDIRFQQKCQKKMLAFKESGVTIVLVTHSIASIIELCDRAMWIENHVIKMIGDPREIAVKYSRASGVDLGLDAIQPLSSQSKVKPKGKPATDSPFGQVAR